MGRVVLGAFVCVLLAISVPGSGTGAAGSRLALMPLPLDVLGARAAALTVDPDSGDVSNATAANEATRPTSPGRLAGLGRIDGYRLDYHDPTSAPLAKGHGLLRVTSEVERYRSGRAARAGLAFVRADSLAAEQLSSSLLAVSMKVFAPASMGRGSSGLLASITPSGKRPSYEADVAFRTGAYVGSVSVSAADASGLQALAVALASKLRSRIEGVLEGTIRGHAVVLPQKPKAGPPPHGPDLAKLALSPTDLGSGRVSHQGYQVDSYLEPISEYDRHMEPGGRFPILDSEVALFHTPTEASYSAGFAIGGFGSPTEVKWAFGDTIAGVPVTSLTSKRLAVSGGDEARAVVVTIRLADGHRLDIAFSAVRVGSRVDLMTFFSHLGQPLPAPALRNVVQTAANRLAGHSRGPVA